MISVRQQFLNRNLGARINRAYVTCKPAHYPQAIGPLGGFTIGGLASPFQRQLRGNKSSSFILGESYESVQQSSRQTEFEAQLATQL
jgi:hypothetical protein